MINVKFSQIFNKNFRTFLHYINKLRNEMLSIAFNIIKSRIHLLFHKNQRRLRHLLHFIVFFVHMTCDI